MADYYPLISRAVAGLDKNTGENRRALYERARKALVDQLRGVQPALSETDITRERLSLEEAIRKVETEAARAMRMASPTARAKPKVEPPPSAPAAQESKPESTPEPKSEELEREEPGPSVAEEEPTAEVPDEAAPSSEAIGPPAPQRPRFERRWIGKKPGEAAEGIKGFGDVVAEAESLGEAVAQAGRNAREVFTQVPSPSPEFERLEPRIEAPGPPVQEARPRIAIRPPVPERRASERPRTAERARHRDRRAPPPPDADLGPVIEDGYDYENETRESYDARYRSVGTAHELPETLRYVSERARRAQEEEKPGLLRRMMGGVVKTVIVVLVLGLVAGTVYWQRNNLIAGVQKTIALVRGPASAPPPAREATQQSTKIPDRIGQPQETTQQEAPVAQRVVLYEEDPVDTAGKRFVGTVVWRSEPSSTSGQPGDRVIRGDITIPERNMQVTWTLGRNFDQSLQFSHTIAIQFTLPPNFDHGEVSEIRGVLMKPAEQVRGTSLAGISVKVKENFFLIGLNSSDADIQRNVQALKERPWFDIAVLYRDGRRAILAIEKGTPGERVFNETFAAWGQ